MKKLLSAFIALTLFAAQVPAQFLFPFPGPGGGGLPPYQFITSAGAGGLNSATTASKDTSGATFISLSIGSQILTATVSDSKSNTWIPLALNNNGGGLDGQQFYCSPCTVGSGHTFTITDVGGAGTINMLAFSSAGNLAPLEQQGGDIGAGNTQSLTPYTAGALFITSTTANNSTPNAINSSFTIKDPQTFTGGMNFGGAAAYFIQTSQAAKSPVWSYTGAAGTTTFAVFRNTFPASPYFLRGAVVQGVNGGTTTAINTSTANSLYAIISTGNNTTPTISDSKSNTWTRLNLNTNANCCATSHIAIYYSLAATVGTGHTFTCGGASTAATCTFAAFVGGSAFDVQDVGTGTSTTNTITPTVNNDIILAGYVTNQQISTASNGFAFVGFGPFQSGVAYASGMAYYVQPTAAAINTTIQTGANPSSIAAFKP